MSIYCVPIACWLSNKTRTWATLSRIPGPSPNLPPVIPRRTISLSPEWYRASLAYILWTLNNSQHYKNEKHLLLAKICCIYLHVYAVVISVR